MERSQFIHDLCLFLFFLTPNISAAPDPPSITSLSSAFYNQLTIAWMKVYFTNYSISINDTNTTNVLLGYNIKTYLHPETYMYTFTGLNNNTVYNISVIAMNCAGNSSTSSVTGKTSEFKLTDLQWPYNYGMSRDTIIMMKI